jgi:hypothetical protein
MKISSYNPNDRYRRRNSMRIFGLAGILISFLIGFGLGLMFSKHKAAWDEAGMLQNIQALQLERDTMQESITAISQQAQTANMRLEALQKTYNEMLPEGALRDLLPLVQKRLEEGMDPKRLDFVIRSTRPPANCTDPQTLRFVPSTPTYKGPKSQISVGEGAIIVEGEGFSATSSSGQVEAWYDPSREVKIRFMIKDQPEKVKTGILPLQESMIAGNREYRFSVEEGVRSFIKVTYDSCDYP